jgi:hypothetical protein
MSYFLPEGYVERPGAVQQLDTAADAWQDEVYAEAARIYREIEPQSPYCCCVVDYGTGSGFKLVKHFGGFCILDMYGLDRTEQVAVNAKKYPTWLWTTPERFLANRPDRDIGLVICADVIEHLDDPDELLKRIGYLDPRILVISTPDRSISWLAQNGPPHNTQHVREWAFQEFGQYIGDWLLRQNGSLVRHFHSNVKQATQCVVARLR